MAQNLPQLLGAARHWFETGLASAMEADGEQPISYAQQLVFSALDAEGTTVAELARRMGVARQSAHQAVHALIGMGLLCQEPDPDSARRRRIRMTAEGRRIDAVARGHIARMEGALADRIGPATVTALTEALRTDWGPPLTPR
ncbi:DNA-binding MarR family transcriptional regulator [Actinocorallia herbida]|uniref:DNA-binding MarR family transcriptional regulator n=1 Tax=Actinocorallia herbida TaxID=58109 RepID=A0A3N1CY32_9ACTN|nr:MarR family winged helix-turn-helix transcriptional regulator [Actinocorallia herbida]ROO86192.1 DNA-binding MarR family transcriptional regulator [Actinocorallia herbida]